MFTHTFSISLSHEKLPLLMFCYGAAPIPDSGRLKNELRDLVFRGEERELGHHTGLTEG